MSRSTDSVWKRSLLSSLESYRWQLWISAVAFPLVGAIGVVYALVEKPDAMPLGLLVFAGSVAASWSIVKLLRWESRTVEAQKALPVVHRVELTRNLPHFFADCECGWFGGDRTSLGQALDDARGHAGMTPTRVTILDDPETDQVYELDVAKADVFHEPLVYRDRETYLPSCSCGWEGSETGDRASSVREAGRHAKRDDVEVVDVNPTAR